MNWVEHLLLKKLDNTYNYCFVSYLPFLDKVLEMNIPSVALDSAHSFYLNTTSINRMYKEIIRSIKKNLKYQETVEALFSK